MFDTDRGRLPQLQNGLVSGIAPANEPFWNQQLFPYFARQITSGAVPDFFQCPTETTNYARGDYGINYRDTFTDIGLVRTSKYSERLASVKNPSRAILLGDAQYMPAGEIIGSWYFVNEATPNSENNVLAKWHRGGANVVFVDGHVLWMQQSQLYANYMPWRNR